MGTFMLQYRYKAYEPGVKEQVVDRALNGSGVRDTVRVLKISKRHSPQHVKKSRYAGTGQPEFPA